MACPGEDVLVDYFAGRVGSDGGAALAVHIDRCPGCHELVAEMARWTPASLAPGVTGSEPGGAEPTVHAGLGSPSQSTVVPDGLVPERLGEYRIRRLLGRGAMGRVYEAHDSLLDRRVAVKFLAEVEPDEAARNRFLVEARAIARLQHPNVVGIHRAGDLNGRPYLVSEFVRGRSLDKLDIPIGWQEALEIATGAARGLAAAHERGVLHRDIKAANIMFSNDRQVKLLDFGLAKLTRTNAVEAATSSSSSGDPDQDPASGWVVPGKHAGWATMTLSGVLLGTPNYLAPEIWHGERATAAADIYSLGVVLHELCTGQPPFRGSTLAELRAAATTGRLVPLSLAAPGVDPRFAAIVDRCLCRSPSERYSSAQDLLSALVQLPAPARVRRASAPGGSPVRSRAWRAPATVAAALAVLVVVAAVWARWPGGTPPGPPSAKAASTAAASSAPAAASTPPEAKQPARPPARPPAMPPAMPPDRPVGPPRRHVKPRPRPERAPPPADFGNDDIPTFH